MAQRLICFDFDGVLVDSLPTVLDSLNEVAGEFSKSSPLDRDSIETLHDVTFPEAARAAGIAPTEMEAFLEQFFKRLVAAASDVPLFPGISTLLRQLQQEFRLFIVSASPCAAINAVLKRENLCEVFSNIYGADVPAPKAEKIRQIIQTEGASAQSAVMIGDSGSDIRAAHQSGVASIAVTWGWQSESLLRAESPTVLVRTVEELDEMLNGRMLWHRLQGDSL